MRRSLAFVLLVALSGCRRNNGAAREGGDAGAPASLDASTVVFDASAATSPVDAGMPEEVAAPTEHKPSEAELTYIRKMRALVYRCKNAHNEIACSEGRMRSTAFSGAHCGHDAVDHDLRFAWASSAKIPDAAERKLFGETYWVEYRSAFVADDVERIDQEPLFLDGTKKDYPIADSYDGNNVIGDATHVRIRRAWLSGAELPRVRALTHAATTASGSVALAVMKGEVLLAIAAGGWDGPTSKRVVFPGTSAAFCKTLEDWQIPTDLESAFD